MDKYGNLPEYLLPFCNIPFQNLETSARVWLSYHLNPEKSSFSTKSGLLQDWRGLAEFFTFAPLYVENFQRANDPLGEVMKNLPIMKPGVTLGDFLLALIDIERYDITEDPILTNYLNKCPREQKTLQPLTDEKMDQVPEIDSQSENRIEILTTGETDTGEPEYFDAFVCFTHQDIEFVREMIYELETKNGLKLCIPDRNMLAGPAKYDAATKIIKERCGTMVIILSPDYLNSEECKFLTFFAHSLGPDARNQKLVPVLYRKCEIPNVLNHLSLVDYTRLDVISWFWSRLLKSVQPKNYQTLPSTTQCFSSASLPSYHSNNSQQLPQYFQSAFDHKNSSSSNVNTEQRVRPRHEFFGEQYAGTLDTISCNSSSSIEDCAVFNSSTSNNILAHTIDSTINNNNYRRNFSDETRPLDRNHNQDFPEDYEVPLFNSIPVETAHPRPISKSKNTKVTKRFLDFLGKQNKK